MSFMHPNIERKIMVDIDNYYEEDFNKNGIEFYCQDISKNKLEQVADSSIDIVMLNHIIEHIENINCFMNEIKRVLKPNAKIYVRTPDIKKTGFGFYDDFTHIRPFTVSGLRHMMTAFGFEEILLVHSNNSTMKIEEFLNLGIGSFGIVKPKEIESVYKKKG